MSSSQSASRFLRFVAVLEILTVFIALVPENLLRAFHLRVGLGPLPHLPLFLYVLRGAAYSQGAIGVLLWIIAGDVARYRALVIATGVIYLAAGPAFYGIHAVAGTPRWWRLLDSITCFGVGAVLLFSAGKDGGIANSARITAGRRDGGPPPP